MEASIVDLRYKTSEILKALEKNESVTVKYHGKVKGVIKPVKEKKTIKVEDHPFFAMNKDNNEILSVEEALEQLLGSRYDF